MIADAVGEGEIDFGQGDLLIGVTSPVVVAAIEKFDGTSSVRTYRSAQPRENTAMTRYVRIPLPTLRLLALELLA